MRNNSACNINPKQISRLYHCANPPRSILTVRLTALGQSALYSKKQLYLIYIDYNDNGSQPLKA